MARHPDRYCAELRTDLGKVFDLLAKGEIRHRSPGRTR
jgi:hypothetical protein